MKIIKKNRRQSLLLFFLSLINLILVGGCLIVLININYLIEVFSTRPINQPLMSSLIPIISKIYDFKVVQNFLIFFFILCFLILNRFYLYRFIKSYQNEIYLITRLGVDKKMGKLPIIYLAVFINGLASILSWLFIYLCYDSIYELIVSRLIGFSLLSFHYFNFTLFTFLTTLSLASVLAVTYFLYWQIVSSK